MALSLCGCANQDFTLSSENDLSSTQQSITSVEEQKLNKIVFNSNYLNDEYISFTGKTHFEDGVVISFSNTYIDINFFGSALYMEVWGDAFTYASVFVDGETDPFKAKKIKTNRFEGDMTIVENLKSQNHHVRIYKVSEAQEGHFIINNIRTDGYFLKKGNEKKLNLEFFGDSITCGYCVEGIDETTPYRVDNENSTKTYAYYATSLLNANMQMTCASGWGMYAGYSGATTQVIPPYFKKSELNMRYDWNSNLYVSDIVVINLGTNDSSVYTRLNDSIEKQNFITNFKQSYIEFINEINNTYPDVKIILSSGMMNMHNDISLAIDEVSNLYDNTYRLKFTSLSVGGPLPAYHPNVNMHKKAAQELAALIESIL